MFPSSIARETINEMPLRRFEGTIVNVNKEDDLHEIIEEVRDEPFLGFDTEKKPTFNKGQYHPTALVQLSTLDKAYLIRLNVIGFPVPLLRLFENPNVLKVGISIHDDIKALQLIRKFDASGFLELNEVAKSIGVNDIGVKKLAAIFLECRISKNQQTSNWENEVLTEAQKYYAATDAWVCAAIYDTLDRRGFLS